MQLQIVIPARLNSTRIHKKMLQELNIEGVSYSLLEIKILQLLKYFDKNQIFLSYADPEFDFLVEKYSINSSIRSEKYSLKNYEDSVTTHEFMNEIVKDCNSEFIAWVPAVVPFHDGKIIFDAVEEFFKNILLQGYDSLVTVSELKHYFWFNDAPLNYYPDSRHVSSQLLTPVLKVTNGLYLSRLENIRKNGYFLGKNIYKYIVPPICSIDIDEEQDLELATALSHNIKL
jgi:CMP-N-acetylneuraminic acid synthetase